MENIIDTIIKDIAIYIRKSRSKIGEETEETLLKHKNELVNFALKNNFRYVLYEEVVSGDRINDRPQMIKLLEDIQDDLYDAVLVIDIDRLGRGDEEDSGKIKRIFRNSGVFIITPNKIYNLENEDDETYLEFQTFLARQEFKMIKKRFIRGKKAGAKQGYWTNGTPPMPYVYNSEIKGLEIDNDKLYIYNLIKDLFLVKLLPLRNIAWELNNMGIPSPRNKEWHGKVIKDILCDETHLGRIISNKTKGNFKKGQKVVHISKDKWIVKENCHKAVKTIEEHNRILQLLSQRKLNTRRGIRPKCILSGIVRCGLCNRVMQIHDNSTYKHKIIICNRYDNYGNACKCMGVKEEYVVEEILKLVDDYLSSDCIEEENNKQKLEILYNELNLNLLKLEKVNAKINKVYESYEDGAYTKEEFLIRKEEKQKELNNITIFINRIKKDIEIIKNTDGNNLKNIYDDFKEKWSYNLDSEEKNLLLKTLINTAYYTRLKEDPNNILVRVVFN